ncbi:MAG: hypothetical protein ACI9QQ_000758 [Myxococcota bacterium]
MRVAFSSGSPSPVRTAFHYTHVRRDRPAHWTVGVKLTPEEQQLEIVADVHLSFNGDSADANIALEWLNAGQQGLQGLGRN